MKKRLKVLIFFILASCCHLNLLAAQDQFIDHLGTNVPFSPAKKEQLPYGGKRETLEENVFVHPCVSLGGGILNKINDIVKDANEFVVFFMYRFNSPVLKRTLEEKYVSSQLDKSVYPLIVFLDDHQACHSMMDSSYTRYVNDLINSVPTSTVKLGSKSFHNKVILTKKKGEEAIVMVGSANATFEADNIHSEDVVFIQSNKLAQFYVNGFYNLLRMNPGASSSSVLKEQAVQIFHHHRYRGQDSNLDVLQSLQPLLEGKEDQSKKEVWYPGNLITAGLSTGFSEAKGTQNCIRIIQGVLKDRHTKCLILFENFLSLKDSGLFQRDLSLLKNTTPKLIVLDDNEHNSSALDLNNEDNTVLLVKPYTNGKFHHKLLIQYFSDRAPVVYTGSFHLSTNAVANNSETVVGIQSYDLADELMASILLNSGVNEHTEIWAFIKKNKRILFQEKSRLLRAAYLTQQKIKNQMDMYTFYLESIRQSFLNIVAQKGDESIFNKYFEHYISEFKKATSLNKSYYINNLLTYLFEQEEFHNSWKVPLKNIVNSINKKLEKNDTNIKLALEGKIRNVKQCLDELNSVKVEIEDYPDFPKKDKTLRRLQDLKNTYEGITSLTHYQNSFKILSDSLEVLYKILEIN